MLLVLLFAVVTIAWVIVTISLIVRVLDVLDARRAWAEFEHGFAAYVQQLRQEA
jgi:hypothetical protein